MSVPVQAGVRPVRETIVVEPLGASFAEPVAHLVVLITVLLCLVGLAGCEDDAIIVVDIHNQSTLRCAVVHADIEPTDDADVSSSVVERRLVEDVGSLAPFLVEEVGVHVVGRTTARPALRQRDVDEQVIARHVIAEDHASCFERLSRLVRHIHGESVRIDEAALAGALHGDDGIACGPFGQ